MFSRRNRILSFVEKGILPPEHTEEAMKLSGVFPNAEDWQRFIGQLLLWLGVLSLAVGIVFFIAFNWDALGKFGKFSLIEGVLILSLLPLVRVDLHARIGQLSLLGASIVVGALLALFGQVYQTGADTWQLFATWGALILPWAVLGRFEPLWILWIGILNVALALYFKLFGFLFFPHNVGMALVALMFNAFVLAVWEYRQQQHPKSSRLWIRFPAVLAGIAATWTGVWAILDYRDGQTIWMGVWIVWLLVHCWVYRQRIRDLFMLTGGCLSLLIVMMTFLVRIFHNLHSGVLGYFVIALALILGGSASAKWLKDTADVWEGQA